MKENIRIPPYSIEDAIPALSQQIPWPIQNTKVPATWQYTMGENVTVYVLDTGEQNHRDISFYRGKSFVRGDRDAKDYNGHSTACSGLIAALNNSEGIVGCAPKAKVICYKVLGNQGSGSEKGITDALRDIYDNASGLVVVSMSLGGTAPMPKVHEEIKRLYRKNIPVICACGNDGGAVNYPARYPETLAIGAIDENGNLTDFSSRDNTTDFVAGGIRVYTTFLNDGYKILAGTSFSCPVVAGIVALMLSKHYAQEILTGKNDCKTVPQIKEHLIKYSSRGKIGKDNKYGYGLIDAEKLIIGHSKKVKIDRPKRPKFKLGFWSRFLRWFNGGKF